MEKRKEESSKSSNVVVDLVFNGDMLSVSSNTDGFEQFLVYAFIMFYYFFHMTPHRIWFDTFTCQLIVVLF